MRKVISLILIGILSLQLFSCGSILYPQRWGQKHSENSQVDWLVVGLDSVGLIFYVLPGVLALAIDVHKGAIYLTENNVEPIIFSLSNVQKIENGSKNINNPTLITAKKQLHL